MVVFEGHQVCQVCLVLLQASEAVDFPVLQQVSAAVACLALQPASEVWLQASAPEVYLALLHASAPVVLLPEALKLVPYE